MLVNPLSGATTCRIGVAADGHDKGALKTNDNLHVPDPSKPRVVKADDITNLDVIEALIRTPNDTVFWEPVRRPSEIAMGLRHDDLGQLVHSERKSTAPIGGFVDANVRQHQLDLRAPVLRGFPYLQMAESQVSYKLSLAILPVGGYAQPKEQTDKQRTMVAHTRHWSISLMSESVLISADE